MNAPLNLREHLDSQPKPQITTFRRVPDLGEDQTGQAFDKESTMKAIGAFISLLLSLSLYSQTPTIEPDPKTALRILADVEALSAPALRGRATGTEGAERAASLLGIRMRETGLSPLPGNQAKGYRIPYSLTRYRLVPEETKLAIDGVSLQWGRDYVSAFARNPGLSIGWRVAILDGSAPDVEASASRAWEEALNAKEGLIIGYIHSAEPPKVWGFYRARAVQGRLGTAGNLPTALNRPMVCLTPSGLDRLGITEANAFAIQRPHEVVYDPQCKEERVECWNLAGYVPGEGPDEGKSVTILSAHFDHLDPEGSVWYPGADDDASGCAVALEVGRRLACHHPKRGVVILLCSGEELGMLGSRAFLASNRIPLASIRADINMDMVGRADAGGLAILPCTGEGPMTALVSTGRDIAKAMGLRLRGNESALWGRSDHLAFAEKAIPVAYVTSGLHPDYHKPTDTPEKLSPGQLEVAATFVERLVRASADRNSTMGRLDEKVWKGWKWPVPSGKKCLDP
jgi:hypothetical protein